MVKKNLSTYARPICSDAKELVFELLNRSLMGRLKMQHTEISLIVAEIKAYLLNWQSMICKALSQIDPTLCCQTDNWCDIKLGYGISNFLEAGSIFEKGGVNFSHVFGKKLPQSALANRSNLENCPFQALGVSVIIHPVNPFVPTSHANLRFFATRDKSHKLVWWFGGGFDLTPCYGFEEDCIYWHEMAKKACEPFGNEIYPRYKEWCDEYFYIKHRKTTRGIGGLFFDNLNNWTFDMCFDFIKSVGRHYVEAYQEIVQRRKNHAFGQKERDFQAYRRSRYVEFNLIYDRGTLFGLQTGGRVESILASMPPRAEWKLNGDKEFKAEEEQLQQNYLTKRNWLSLAS